MKAASAAMACVLVLGACASCWAYDPKLDEEAPLEVVQPSTAPAPLEEPSVLRIDAQGPMVFDGPVGGAFDHALRPAYRAAERASDHVYEFLRSYVVQPLFPGRLTRGLEEAPDHDSYDLFRQKLREKEARYAERLRDTYPLAQLRDGNPADSVGEEHVLGPQVEQWQQAALEEQQSVIVAAFGDALMARYDLDRMGRYSEGYARDRRNWDPSFFTMAALVGSAFAYGNGVHAVAPIGDWKLYVDLRAMYRVQRSLAAGSPETRIGDMELGYRRIPVRLTSTWGVVSGHVRDELVGLKYDLRF